MFGKYIDFRFFIISLTFGLFLTYIYRPAQTIIYVYPTPQNINNLQFRDKANNCYHFQQKEVKCPTDTSKIYTIPLQDGIVK
jgi:hypothetical protein